MKCPFQKIKTSELIKPMAIASSIPEDGILITREGFAECSIGDCPYYENRAGKDYCKKVEMEERR